MPSRTSSRPTRPPRGRSPRCARGWRAPFRAREVPARARASVSRGQPQLGREPELPVEHGARRNSKAWSSGSCEYIHAGDAFQVVPSQRWSAPVPVRGVLDLQGPARGQPEPLHVLPGLRRLPGRGSQPGAAADRERASRLDAADRRDPSARREPRGGPADRGGAAGRREGARRARDAGRPGTQRSRAGVRVRQRHGRRVDGDRVTTAT